jgi:hypothetical protein
MAETKTSDWRDSHEQKRTIRFFLLPGGPRLLPATLGFTLLQGCRTTVVSEDHSRPVGGQVALTIQLYTIEAPSISRTSTVFCSQSREEGSMRGRVAKLRTRVQGG